MPLTISVQSGSNISIYRQIVEQVCAAVQAGKIAEDEPLPSVRSLAQQLVINPNTVGRAYSELVRGGILESRSGRGVFVCKRRQIYSKPERRRRLQQAVASLVAEGFMLGFDPHEIEGEVTRQTREMASTAMEMVPVGGSR